MTAGGAFTATTTPNPSRYPGIDVSFAPVGCGIDQLPHVIGVI